MRETRMSGSEGGGTNPIVSPYPYRVPLRAFVARNSSNRLTVSVFHDLADQPPDRQA
jgi:hypothetical protein